MIDAWQGGKRLGGLSVGDVKIEEFIMCEHICKIFFISLKISPCILI